MTNQSIANIVKMTPQGVAKWRKENRPIIALLEKYFSKEDLEEFIASGKCTKFEKYHHIEFNILRDARIKYISSFKKYDRFTLFNFVFLDFYFNFLVFLRTKKIFVYDFHGLLDEFKISYFLLKKGNFEKFFDLLQRDLDVFRYWDDGMLIYLDSLLKSSLQDLLYEAHNKEERNTFLYQIIGYYIYSNYTSLNMMQKLNITSVIFHKIKEEDINTNNITSLIIQTYDKHIDEIIPEVSPSQKKLNKTGRI